MERGKKNIKRSVNLSMIKNVKSIHELSKYYNEIRDYIYLVDRNSKQDMDDLVQDTFMRLQKIWDNFPDKVINGGYVALTIRSIRMNNLKIKNRTDKTICDFDDFIDQDTEYDNISNDKYDWDKYDEIIENLSWYEKKVYEYCLTMNISELSRQSGISQKSLRLTFIKIKEKIKNELTK